MNEMFENEQVVAIENDQIDLTDILREQIGLIRNSSVKLIDELIDIISSVSAAINVEQSAASSQQASGSMEDVSESAKELAILAEQLHEELTVFKLEKIS